MRYSLTFIIALACITTLVPPRGAAADGTLLVAKDWTQGWSGLGAAILPAAAQDPDGQAAVSWTWTRVDEKQLPNWSRSFPVVPIRGDVAAFWLRVDRPVERLQIILSGADDVGAERSVPELLDSKAIEPHRWHYVVWPIKTHPGWVRYSRARMDWDHIKGVSLYTWNDQVEPKLTVAIGPVQVLTYAHLDTVFARHPERVRGNRSLAWRVLQSERPDRMMAEYHRRRAAEQVAALRAKYPPARLAESAAEVRQALAATYLMPPRAEKPMAKMYGTLEIDGIRIEKLLLQTGEGVYSPALVFLPGGKPRYPALLMLPGHGDPYWSVSMQSRCLGFARQGYLVMVVQPFGQAERGEVPTWVESHDSQSAAYLLPAGQSLLGLIMADHRSELSYLLERADVDAARVVVTGVSMGGTHSLWLSAIEPRLRAAVGVAVAAIYDPDSSFLHHGLCDLMVGAYQVADGQMIQALSAPRALMNLCPSTQQPVRAAGQRRFLEGWIGHDELLRGHRLQDAELIELDRYTREAYAAWKAPDRFVHVIAEGPHDYTRAMRETAAGWFAHHLRGAAKTAPLPEPLLTPISKRADAVAALTFWPKGGRPPEILAPTAYVQRQIADCLTRLSAPPDRIEDWKARREQLRGEVARLAALHPPSPHSPGATRLAALRAEKGTVHQLIARPEPGVDVSILLFSPDQGVRPDGRLVVLLHPDGMTHTTSGDERRRLTAAGAWVLCADLRGMGETRCVHESGAYLGFRDMDLAMAASRSRVQ
jgi:hypothetical protein